ncbi:ATP-binding cassette domain-containing protein [Ralstonia mannitolilytica]|uniref:ATP-binding cassette domain-containing protein n=1 Tax=Ralstonia mannitolilytica TaxID=105219 RepID=UPI0007AFEF11|nr:ATP-binding cassette domain-containing protein [Ralstonia mannitolilytica]ANA31910.1 hypothetical protein VZ52_00035 [Ralstonia mannitolilytica]
MTAPLDPALQPPRKTGALALSTYNLTKRFGSFTALDGVSIDVRPGTVHALLGENGAGKSTLVKAIVGYHLPDDGAVLIDGREQAITSPVVARQLGIGMVYQHFTVVPGMTVAENLLLAKGTNPTLLGAEMMGQVADSGARQEAVSPSGRMARDPFPSAPVRLRVDRLEVAGDRGEMAVQGLSVQVRGGEIVGVAGVSGNGQRELMEALVGQRDRAAGEVWIADERYEARRAQNQRLNVRSLPEEPLRNACVGDLSVAMNIGLRRFDQAPAARAGWLRGGVLRAQARELIATYKVKTQGENAPIRSLSGGNVQRAVLARELDGQVDVLLVSNPVFGLDFAAVAEIHSRIMAVRNAGGAVLLLSEDLDELLKLADRIVVMSEGRIVHECMAADADRHVLGTFMGGHHHDEPEREAA